MKNSLSFSIVIVAVLLVFSCTKEDQKNLFTDAENTECSISSYESAVASGSFEVSHSSLSKYLKVFKRNKSVEFVEPITEDGVTLAYYVKYANNQGWDLISADMRVTPVLASCSEGSLFLGDTKNPAIQAVKGMLSAVRDVRSESMLLHKNRVWEFIEPTSKEKVYTKRISDKDTNILNRAFGSGMWIPVDTSYNFSQTNISRLISTAWGQGNPWDAFTPYRNANHDNALVGCGPVAGGQLIYKYIAPNPMLADTIPTNADNINTITNGHDTNKVLFNNFSTSAWSNIVLDCSYPYNFFNTGQTALFLSWLGKKMHSVYYDTTTIGTDTSVPNLLTVLNEYLSYRVGIPSSIQNSSTSTIKKSFCDTVINSLGKGSPVLIVSPTHYYIIDYYERNIEEVIITYSFDQDYEYTLEEYEQGESWMFMWPASTGDHGEFEDLEKHFVISDLTYFKMNWGWQDASSNNNYNNIKYLVKEGPTMYSSSSYFYLSWIANGDTFNTIQSWYHHFSRNNN